MKEKLQWAWRWFWSDERLLVVGFLATGLMMYGLLFSRGLLSSGMISMISNMVLNRRIGFWFKVYIKDIVLLAFTLIFFSRLLSVINSSPTTFMMDRIRIWLPFIILPFGFVIMKQLPAKFIRLLFLFFISMMLVECIHLTVLYFNSQLSEGTTYSTGHTMNTPFSHIRFSLMVAFAFVLCVSLLRNNAGLFPVFEKWFLLITSVFLFAFMHLLAVRSGLVAMYLCILILILNEIWVRKNRMIGLAILICFLCVALISFWFVPTLHQKIGYMKYDLSQFFDNQNPSQLSDASRVISIQKGLVLFKQNPMMGTGIGDLKKEMNALYQNYPDMPSEKRLPHNEFIYVLASGGLIGLLLFGIGIFTPLFFHKNYKQLLFLCFYIIILSSFITEATLEEQIGTGFYSVFGLLIYSNLNFRES